MPHISDARKGFVGCYSRHASTNQADAHTVCSAVGGYMVNIDSAEEDEAVRGKLSQGGWNKMADIL